MGAALLHYNRAMGNQQNIRIFQTADHECGYWRDRLARDLVLDPEDARLPSMYGQALMLGFRRSGSHIYRPNCIGCSACVPVRVPSLEFQPNRNQRRCLLRNADLQISVRPAHRNDEVFDLYQRYLNYRHAGAGMDDPEAEDFDNFLICQWSPTVFLEIRDDTKLLAVAVPVFPPKQDTGVVLTLTLSRVGWLMVAVSELVQPAASVTVTV